MSKVVIIWGQRFGSVAQALGKYEIMSLILGPQKSNNLAKMKSMCYWALYIPDFGLNYLSGVSIYQEKLNRALGWVYLIFLG